MLALSCHVLYCLQTTATETSGIFQTAKTLYTTANFDRLCLYVCFPAPEFSFLNTDEWESSIWITLRDPFFSYQVTGDT